MNEEEKKHGSLNKKKEDVHKKTDIGKTHIKVALTFMTSVMASLQPCRERTVGCRASNPLPEKNNICAMETTARMS